MSIECKSEVLYSVGEKLHCLVSVAVIISEGEDSFFIGCMTFSNMQIVCSLSRFRLLECMSIKININKVLLNISKVIFKTFQILEIGCLIILD